MSINLNIDDIRNAYTGHGFVKYPILETKINTVMQELKKTHLPGEKYKPEIDENFFRARKIELGKKEVAKRFKLMIRELRYIILSLFSNNFKSAKKLIIAACDDYKNKEKTEIKRKEKAEAKRSAEEKPKGKRDRPRLLRRGAQRQLFNPDRPPALINEAEEIIRENKPFYEFTVQLGVKSEDILTPVVLDAIRDTIAQKKTISTSKERLHLDDPNLLKLINQELKLLFSKKLQIIRSIEQHMDLDENKAKEAKKAVLIYNYTSFENFKSCWKKRKGFKKSLKVSQEISKNALEEIEIREEFRNIAKKLNDITESGKPGLTIRLLKVLTNAEDDQAVAMSHLVDFAAIDPVLEDMDPMGCGLAEAKLGFIPKFYIQIKKDRYTKLRDMIENEYGGLEGIYFDDKSNKICTSLEYQQLAEIIGGFFGYLSFPDDNRVWTAIESWRMFYIAFATKEAVKELQKERLALIKDCCLKFIDYKYDSYDVVFSDNENEKLRTALLKGNGTQEALQALTKENGFIIGESHDESIAKEFLIDNMNMLKKQGYHTIYIEHIGDHYQQALDNYLEEKSTKMSIVLEKFLERQGQSLKKLVEEAKKHQVRVVGLEIPSVTRRIYSMEDELVVRTMTLNQVGVRKIEKDRIYEQRDKFIILAGKAHTHTHPGLTCGIPGFSQLLKVPCLLVDKSKQLRLFEEDKSNRAPVLKSFD